MARVAGRRSRPRKARSTDDRARGRGNYFVREEPYSDRDWRVASTNLDLAVGARADSFTIGRCVTRSIRLLQLRYSTSVRIVVIWQGRRGAAAKLEADLQDVSCYRYPGRTRNQNRGGGRQAPDLPHYLYVVLWGAVNDTAPNVESLLEGHPRILREGILTSCRVPRRQRRRRR